MNLQSRASSSSSSWSSSSSSLSSLSSLSKHIWKHDVFLSYRHDDTFDFTHKLSTALEEAGITTFSFHKNLFMGSDALPDQHLLKEIEESQLYLVVFSTNYAASIRCLDELATIAGCIKEQRLSVVTVFYGVDPSEVRCSWYGKHFAEHEEKFRLNLVKLRRLRLARTFVARCRGLVVQNGIDLEVIDKIVKKAMEKLGHDHVLVGIQSRVQKLEKLLDLGSNAGVRSVGICGMGGIGKTTLAEVTYDKISHHFDVCCFLSNVSEHSAKPSGLSRLRGKLFHTLWETTNNNLRRMLIVLDDVDKSRQLEVMIGSREWFGVGSRIIITTRDENILKLHRVDEIYRIELLNKDEAFQLFCTTAFKCGHPIMSDYEEMTNNVLKYADGLPLAIKSLGSLLLNRSVPEWRSSLVELDKSILRVLKRSYDGLINRERKIFLDIACFFAGEEINYVQEILSSVYGNDIKDRIVVLIDKSLVIILNQRIQMHFMLQKMGQDFVRRQSHGELGNQRNLWLYDDIRQVLEKNIGTKNVSAIVLLNQNDPEGTPLKMEGLSTMSNLRLVIFRNVNFSGRLVCLSDKLRYLSWHKYPSVSLPSSFDPYELVELIMPDSSIVQLWGTKKCLPMLRSLNLRGSERLMKMPDFEGLPNLERMDLEGCTSLLQLPPSVAFLPNLKLLNLRNCTGLLSIPNKLFGLSSLEILNLAGCSQLAECLSFNHSFSPKGLIKEKLRRFHFPRPFFAK